MGTPERQKPVSPVVVIKGEAAYFPEELSEEEWKEIVRSALSALGPLKDVSGFRRLSEFLNITVCRRFRQIIDPKKLSFHGTGLGPQSLCRKMATVFSSQVNERKDEQELFLLKDGKFAILTGLYVFSSLPIPGGESDWHAFSASFQLIEQEDLSVLSAKNDNPPMFWAELFRSIHALSANDSEQKSERALIAKMAFDRISRMRSKIILPPASL